MLERTQARDARSVEQNSRFESAALRLASGALVGGSGGERAQSNGRFGRSWSTCEDHRNPRFYWILDDLDDLFLLVREK
jgi:hypothetical protein